MRSRHAQTKPSQVLFRCWSSSSAGRMFLLLFILWAAISAIGQSPHAHPLRVIAIPLANFQGEVVDLNDDSSNKHRSYSSVSGATVQEFMLGGSQPVAQTITDKNGRFQLPNPSDGNIRTLVTTDSAGHLSVIHVRLASSGVLLRIHLHDSPTKQRP